MLGNFSYCNPTKLHFGPESLDALAGELARADGQQGTALLEASP
jgi:alcohol dehydrogenase YqhD (iron-dependent ADH family)